jgi:hypothetical protein
MRKSEKLYRELKRATKGMYNNNKINGMEAILIAENISQSDWEEPLYNLVLEGKLEMDKDRNFVVK